MADPIIDKLKDALGEVLSQRIANNELGLIDNNQITNYTLLSIAQSLAELADLS